MEPRAVSTELTRSGSAQGQPPGGYIGSKAVRVPRRQFIRVGRGCLCSSRRQITSAFNRVDPFESDVRNQFAQLWRGDLMMIAGLMRNERSVIEKTEQRVVRAGYGATPVLVAHDTGFQRVSPLVKRAGNRLEPCFAAWVHGDVSQQRRHYAMVGNCDQ